MTDGGIAAATSPLVRLPRELLDQIYNHLKHKSVVTLAESIWSPDLRLQGYFKTSYCLVSRQFGTEHRDLVEREMILHIRLFKHTASHCRKELSQPDRAFIYGKVRHIVVD